MDDRGKNSFGLNTMAEVEREVTRLRARCRYLENENRQKDEEISELKKAHKNLSEMKRSASFHTFHPTLVLDGLSEEFEVVKTTLQDTAAKCQQLLSHLDVVTRAKSPVETKSRDFQTQTSCPEGLEEHAMCLQATVNDLNRKLEDWKQSHIFSTQAVQHETFQDAIVCYHEAQNENALLRTENLRLNRSVEDMRRVIENVTEVHATEDAAAKEHIQILKQQTLTYSEDFESERRDREAAQSRVAALEAEVSSLKQVVQNYEARQMEEIRQRRDEALTRYRREYERRRSSTSLYQTDGQPSFIEPMGEDTTDSGNNAAVNHPPNLPLNSI